MSDEKPTKYNLNVFLGLKPGVMFYGYDILGGKIAETWSSSDIVGLVILDENLYKIKEKYEPAYTSKTGVDLYCIPSERLRTDSGSIYSKKTSISADLFDPNKPLGLFTGSVLRDGNVTWVNILTSKSRDVWILHR